MTPKFADLSSSGMTEVAEAGPVIGAEPVFSFPAVAPPPIYNFICCFYLRRLAICVDVEVVLVRIEPSE